MDTLEYYYTLQREARSRTIEALNRRAIRTGKVATWNKVTLCSILGKEIGDACNVAATEWRKYRKPESHQDFDVDWTALAQKNFKDPDHFNLAIWQEVNGKQTLVALALGNPSHGRKYMTVKWVERFFAYTPVAGSALLAILSCAESMRC
ncbi:MAG: hypothetical protein Q4P24_07025 [Rhodobacterales bacterium]|nr:hypothetical protein [Rhodobacterales bacterium]